ncbi:HAAS signaling domain-containing protein [Streptomyces sp. NPDC101249]|uniref:HAAS signaling domain-containing protein n=1 Tax=Streptomyces sp. NPDC101249 TaxID=3366140 RepID=UPI003822CAA1
MKDLDHPLVAAYLDAVAREAAGLSPGRRDELIADLREHIEVALAERPDGGTTDVTAVLDRLGSPGDIVTSAREDEPVDVPPGGWHAFGPLVLLPMAGVLVMVHAVVSLLALAAGVTLLWTAPHWSRRDKTVGTAVAVLAPLSAVVITLTIGAYGQLGPALLIVVMVTTLLPVGVSLHLFRSGRRAAN